MPATAPAPAADGDPSVDGSDRTLPLTRSTGPPPLDLRLHPAGRSAGVREPGPIGDPRANTARATFETRLAAAVGGDGVWREERLDVDRVRFRRGSTCVDVERSRADQLDAFNRAVIRRPWVAKRPEPC